MTHEHENGQNVPNNIKRSIMHLNRNGPIIIKTVEAVKQYNIRKGKGSQTQLLDSEVELKNWPHPAEAVKITEAKGHEEQMIQTYTDGSKNEQGVGSGVVISAGKELAAQIKLKLDSRYSKNQAE